MTLSDKEITELRRAYEIAHAGWGYSLKFDDTTQTYMVDAVHHRWLGYKHGYILGVEKGNQECLKVLEEAKNISIGKHERCPTWSNVDAHLDEAIGRITKRLSQ